MKNKLLLIIDPQIDFITGSLPIPGAVNAMDSLAEYMRCHSSGYARIVATGDRHPMRHRSFISEGGEWPAHCVTDSVGAAIWQPVMDELMKVPDKVTILHKGEKEDYDEYSIFKNEESARKLLDIIRSADIAQTDICGLAGDVCVADTIRDWMSFRDMPELCVLAEFSPSIDGGATLDSLISKFGLACGR